MRLQKGWREEGSGEGEKRVKKNVDGEYGGRRGRRTDCYTNHDKAKHMQSGNKNPRLPTLINTHYTNAVVKQPTAIPFTVLCKPHLPPSSLSLSLLPPERACGSGLHTPTTTHTHTLLPFTASHTCTE